MKLGKLAARHDLRTLKLANYLGTLPPPKPAVDYTRPVGSWPMYANDTIGDCTCAAAGHLIQEWTANIGKPLTPTEGQIVGAYEAITGYKPDDPSTDRGAVEIDVLNYWRRTGIAGRTILVYAALEPGNHDHVRDAVELFGAAYIGVQLPLSAQGQSVWSVPPGGPTGQGAPGSWGGHAIPVVAYDPRILTVVTWGRLLNMTWQFWDTYCDEAYVILTQDWIDQKGLSPAGFNLDQLKADLAQVTG
jgi:hypothetical protein